MTEELSHRSYLIKRPNESTIRRNRRHLRLSRERPRSVENSYDSDLNVSATEEDEKCEPDSESEDNEECEQGSESEEEEPTQYNTQGLPYATAQMATGLEH